MDTEALWQAIAAYGNARWRGVKFEQDAADHLSEIKAILNRAEAETRELLVTNERLVDEVNEARKETSEQARLNGMGAEREASLLARINRLEKALRELHDATQLVSVGNYDQEAHDLAVSRARAALEKKYEST